MRWHRKFFFKLTIKKVSDQNNNGDGRREVNAAKKHLQALYLPSAVSGNTYLPPYRTCMQSFHFKPAVTAQSLSCSEQQTTKKFCTANS